MKYILLAFVVAGIKIKLIILLGLAILAVKVAGVRAEEPRIKTTAILCNHANYDQTKEANEQGCEEWINTVAIQTTVFIDCNMIKKSFERQVKMDKQHLVRFRCSPIK